MTEQAVDDGPARVAIYFAPPPTEQLWAFGSALLGYDAAVASEHAFPEDLPCDASTWREWTEAPRQYGFHATLKAPFRLRDGIGIDDVVGQAALLACELGPIFLPRLVVRSIGSFVALVPDTAAPALDALAASCVEAFEPLRAPLTFRERERRLRSPLSPRQVELLDRYGYPHVLEQFRFHMTLTGSLPADRIEPVRGWLAERYWALRPGLTVDAVTVFAQRSASDRFEIQERLPFRG